MEKENKIKAPTVEVIIRTNSEWEGKEVSTCKREFLNEDTIRWPDIIQTFYGALRGFDYIFPENVKQILEELSEYEFDPDNCSENDKEN